MSENLTIQSPDFIKVEKEAGPFTADAVRLLWFVLNDHINTTRRGLRVAQESLQPKVKTDTPGGNLDNYPTEGASYVLFLGGTFNLTGLLAPEPGKARLMMVHNAGAGTVTIKNNVTSVNENRILTESGSDVSLVTRGSIMLGYLNNRWRELG